MVKYLLIVLSLCLAGCEKEPKKGEWTSSYDSCLVIGQYYEVLTVDSEEYNAIYRPFYRFYKDRTGSPAFFHKDRLLNHVKWKCK